MKRDQLFLFETYNCHNFPVIRLQFVSVRPVLTKINDSRSLPFVFLITVPCCHHRADGHRDGPEGDGPGDDSVEGRRDHGLSRVRPRALDPPGRMGEVQRPCPPRESSLHLVIESGLFYTNFLYLFMYICFNYITTFFNWFCLTIFALLLLVWTLPGINFSWDTFHNAFLMMP